MSHSTVEQALPANKLKLRRMRSTVPAYPQGVVRLAVRSALRSLLEGVAWVVPSRRHVAVYGIPDLEGNVVEVARSLLARDESTIVWLTARGQLDTVEAALDGIEHRDRLRVVRKRSLLGFVSYLTADSVFYTHRLFLSPRPVRGRLYVNVWHGDGPKLVGSLPPTRPADSLLVAGTEFWGTRKAQAFGVDKSRLLVVGNPRIDQFLRPGDDNSLVQLGVDPQRPFVVWAPTFRQAGLGRRRWSDTDLLSDGSAGQDLRRLASSRTRSGA